MGAKQIEWISLNEAEALVKGYFTRGTLYKYIHLGKLERKGPFHNAHVRRDQLLKVTKLEGIVK